MGETKESRRLQISDPRLRGRCVRSRLAVGDMPTGLRRLNIHLGQLRSLEGMGRPLTLK